MDPDGKPFKVVKYATDVTAQKLQNADYQGQIAAIGKAQAVIEVNMDGTIITVNDNPAQIENCVALGDPMPTDVMGRASTVSLTP